LRHCHKNSEGSRLVTFVLAGFTERGTAAAGAYLAQNWKSLVIHHKLGTSLDNFLLVIEGPSDWSNIKEWAPDPKLHPITPSRLKDIAPQLSEGPWIEEGQDGSV